MAILENLLAASRLRSEVVTIDGVAVTVRELTASGFAEYGESTKKDRHEANARLVAECVLDESGQPFLTMEEAREVARSARMAVPIVSAIMELSGFGADEKKG